ncbi:MAG: iron-containing alcohol dehydrogenase [Mailhella sp.]|nr:iron-containing alcohol dehydrogenase [Mailhella sp.]
MNFTLTQSIKVFEQNGAITQIGELMREAGFHKAFLVCDAGIVKLGVAEKIQNILAAEGLECVLFDKVLPDPPAEIVDEGAALCKAEACDCVIAVGGGSSIDTGKGINILRFNEGKILDYAMPGSIKVPARGLICIPTTSGTGSELSNGLIISDVKNEVKVPILAVEGMSEYALLDPELTVGMPAGLTMVTGLDVFSHACEAYSSILGNAMTDAICEKIMADVVEFLPRVVADGKDILARERMLGAASLGGWMLACASAHVGHSIAHVLGAKFHIPHGKACAYSLPAVFELLTEQCPDKNRRVGEILGVEFDAEESTESIMEKTSQAYRKFCAELGLEAIPVACPSETEMDALVDAVVNEPLGGVSPVKATPENIRPLLKKLFTA